MWKSLVFAVSFSASCVLAQDTVWIESPRLINMRRSSEKTLHACIEVADALRSAYYRIEHAVPGRSITAVSDLDTIIANEEMPIHLTMQAKELYLGKLQEYFRSLKDQYDDAAGQVKLCDFLRTYRKFYIRDKPVNYYYDKLSQKQIDSMYNLYLEENAPDGNGMYYFDDWLWLRIHHQLPQDERTSPQRKEETSAELG